jgi:hypothetical protein
VKRLVAALGVTCLLIGAYVEPAYADVAPGGSPALAGLVVVVLLAILVGLGFVATRRAAGKSGAWRASIVSARVLLALVTALIVVIVVSSLAAPVARGL